MSEKLPEFVNQRRRASVKHYSLLAIVVYHIPLITAYLAVFSGLAKYTYYDINIAYMGILTGWLASIILIFTRREFTKNFLTFILYFQISLCIFHIFFTAYIMNDLRIVSLVSSLLGLVFVFTYSALRIAILLIILISMTYLMISFIAITYMGQAGSFGKEVVHTIVFLPVAFFIAYMSSLIKKQHKELRGSQKKLKDTFSELEFINEKLESYNTKMVESIRYAEMIQRSLLPGIDRMKTQTPDSFVIWMPKDIVGGDIFYTYKYDGGFIVAILDCTGHGVPGAFLTMIAYTEMRKIIMADDCMEPSEILSRLNASIRTTLHHDDPDSISEDGLDAAVCNVNINNLSLTFSGARIPLFYVRGGEIAVIKGDKESIGYKDSNTAYKFSSHTIAIEPSDCFYFCTDGYTDQLGGEKNIRFGKKRFKNMLCEINHEAFDRQREILLHKLFAYKGENEQQDDITAIGFRI